MWLYFQKINQYFSCPAGLGGLTDYYLWIIMFLSFLYALSGKSSLKTLYMYTLYICVRCNCERVWVYKFLLSCTSTICTLARLLSGRISNYEPRKHKYENFSFWDTRLCTHRQNISYLSLFSHNYCYHVHMQSTKINRQS